MNHFIVWERRVTSSVVQRYLENNMDYEQLKQKFISDWKKYANDSHFRSVLHDDKKSKIRDIINSSRVLETIDSIDRLFSVLQQRDEDNAINLRCIILFAIDIKQDNRWLSQYLKDVDSFIERLCKDPKKELQFPVKLSYLLRTTKVVSTRRPIPGYKAQSRPVDLQPIKGNEIADEMEKCFEYIRKHVGSDWKIFLRALPKITEKQMNYLRNNSRDGRCLVECLRWWKETHKNDPQIYNKEVLIEAAVKCSSNKRFANGLIGCSSQSMNVKC